MDWSPKTNYHSQLHLIKLWTLELQYIWKKRLVQIQKQINIQTVDLNSYKSIIKSPSTAFDKIITLELYCITFLQALNIRALHDSAKITSFKVASTNILQQDCKAKILALQTKTVYSIIYKKRKML